MIRGLHLKWSGVFSFIVERYDDIPDPFYSEMRNAAEMIATNYLKPYSASRTFTIECKKKNIFNSFLNLYFERSTIVSNMICQ